MEEEVVKRKPGRPRGKAKVQVRVGLAQDLYAELEHWREELGLGLSEAVADALVGWMERLGRKGKRR